MDLKIPLLPKNSWHKYLLLLALLLLSAPLTATADSLEAVRKQAESGDAQAQLQLGDRLLRGDGVAQNLADGAKWLRKSAEQKNPEAQFRLAHLYREGKGVPRDLKEAAAWLTKAATLGHGEAQLELGEMRHEGLVNQ
jgi:hypothetical protein